MKKAVSNASSSQSGPSRSRPIPARAKKIAQQRENDVRMQWFILILLPIWILVVIVAATVAFCITKSPLSFSLFSLLAAPTAYFRRCCVSIFRLDEQEFQIELESARAKRGLSITRWPETAVKSLAKSVLKDANSDKALGGGTNKEGT